MLKNTDLCKGIAMKFAVIENGIVINIIVWDGEAPHGLADTLTLVPVDDNEPVYIGTPYAPAV